MIQGLERDLENEDREKSLFDAGDLGIPRVRDPDALPPRNWAEWVMARGHNFITGLGGGNLMFAIKGGILTGTQQLLFFNCYFFFFEDLSFCSAPLFALVLYEYCEVCLW